MKTDIITNLTEEEIYQQYLAFEEECENCKIAHSACRIRTDCTDCYVRPFIMALRKKYKK